MTGDSQATNDFSAVYFTAERTDVLREWSLGGGRVGGWLHACACVHVGCGRHIINGI